MTELTTLHAFSGGIDSTYNLWRWLEENPDKTLLVHHITYHNHEGRGDAELKAVHDILAWLKEKDLTNYIYIESLLDLTAFKYIGLDSTTLAALHGTLIAGYRTVRYKTDNTPINEWTRLGETEMNRRRDRASKIIRIVAGRNLSPVYSLRNMKKEEIIAAMPPDLLALCWYCRRPRKDGSICGKCHTCKQVKKGQDRINAKSNI